METWLGDYVPTLVTGGAQTNVTNTAARTVLVGGLDISNPQIGDVYTLRAWGTISNSTGAAVNYSMDLGFGANTYLSQAVLMALGSSVNARSWVVNVDLVVTSLTSQSIGMSTVWSNSNGAAGTLEVSAGSSGYFGVGAATATEDFKAFETRTLALYVTMGTASASASARCLGFTFTRRR